MSISTLQKRYATKVFGSKKINSEDLQILIDSLILTPSSFGLQPWHFLIISKPELKSKLQQKAWNQAQVGDCSHLIVLCAKTDLKPEEADKFIDFSSQITKVPIKDLEGYKQMISAFLSSKSANELTTWAEKQVYIALGFLMFACSELAIDSCPMEGFDKTAFDEILSLKEKGLTAALICPVGYRGDDKYANIPKIRYSRETLVSLID